MMSHRDIRSEALLADLSVIGAKPGVLPAL
jgi:hypothetical protein